MWLVQSIWDFTASLAVFDFYPFIGIFPLILIWFLLSTEEGSRFKAHGHGSRGPGLGIALRLMCAALNWRDHLNRRTRVSVLMRHERLSVFPVLSWISSANGRLHLSRFLHNFLAESVDSSCAHVRKTVFFTVLLPPSHLSCRNTLQGLNRLNFTSIHLRIVTALINRTCSVYYTRFLVNWHS